MPQETELYPPVKALLEGQGYVVKSEIGAIDVVAIRPEAPDEPLVVELKTGFSLTLFHQAIARLAVSDTVYIAVPRGSGKRWQSSLKSNVKLCRRLGLGLMTVRLGDGLCQIHCDPTPYTPRQSKPRKARLLKEFAKREGDPNSGGATRVGLVTAYRQDAEKIRAFLEENGPSKGSEVAKAAGVARATTMMADNHYGWFTRVERGIYALSDTAEGKSG